MVRPLDRFPPELLLSVARCLQKLDEVLNLRLVCKSFASVGASWLQENVTTLCFTSSPKSMRIFEQICTDSVFNQHIREVVYVGDTRCRRQYSSLNNTNALGVSLGEDVFDDIAEIQEFLNHDGRQSRDIFEMPQQSVFDIFCNGLHKLPRLSKITYSRGWPKQHKTKYTESSWFYDLPALVFNPLGAYLERTYMQTGDDYPPWGELNVTSAHCYHELSSSKVQYRWGQSYSNEDWATACHVFEALPTLCRTGRYFTLGMQNVSLSSAKDEDEHEMEVPFIFPGSYKWDSLSTAMPYLTELDISLTERPIRSEDDDPYLTFVRVLNQAQNLQTLSLKWHVEEMPEFAPFVTIMAHCTFPKLRAVTFDRSKVEFSICDIISFDYYDGSRDVGLIARVASKFFAKHSCTLEAILLRNVILCRRPGKGATPWSQTSGPEAVESLRQVLSSMTLQQCHVLVDTLWKPVNVNGHLEVIDLDLVNLMNNVAVRRQEYELRSHKIEATYDYGPWLTDTLATVSLPIRTMQP